jgi:cation transport ATPase
VTTPQPDADRDRTTRGPDDDRTAGGADTVPEERAARAIAEAKAAARSAGLLLSDDGASAAAGGASGTGGTDGTPDTDGTAGRGALTSFTFHLSGLTSAVRARQVEDALNEVPGVQARVIFSTDMAWVTAPDTLSPDVLRALMAELGVDSWLTTASLRRRSERLGSDERSRRLRRSRAAVRQRQRSHRQAREQQREQARARLSAVGRRGTGSAAPGGNAGTEVLYTARDLITNSRLLIAVVLGLPVVLLQNVEAWQFDYWQWVSLGLSLPVVVWSAWPFHRALLSGLRRGMSALDTASSLAVVTAFLYSLGVMLFGGTVGDPQWRSGPAWTAFAYDEHSAIFLDVACGVTILLLLGRLASRRTRIRSALLLDALSTDGAAPVTVVRNDRRGKPLKFQISTAEIRVGDDILVPNGATVPVDGEVVGGKAQVDMGPFGRGAGSGDAALVGVTVNSRIYAGARNLGGPLKIRAQRTGSRTRLAAMARWIRAAERDENRLDQVATRSASLLVPWALVLAVIAFSTWVLIADSPEVGMAVGLAVLVAVAPVTLAVSTTLALRVGLARAAAGGTLLRNANTIHQLAAVDTIIFNRAGTLTTGQMQVVGVTAAKGENPEMVLRVAGALALESRHAVSRAIVRADREARDTGSGGSSVPHWLETGPVEVDAAGTFRANIELPTVEKEDSATSEGRGRTVRHVQATLWRPRDLSELSDPALANAAVGGGVPLVVSWKGRARGVINVADTVKPDAEKAVNELEDMDIETTMLARDTYPVARRMANSLGISTVLAGIAPGRKAATVRSVHARGATVAMVGDKDILDCLRVADVGILMGSADRIDNAESDVVLIREDISVIPQAVNLVRHVRATVDWNLWLAWGYNILALVLSVLGVLNPLVATVPMLASSLLIEWRSARIGTRDYTASADGSSARNSGGLPSRWVGLRSWAGENLLPWQSD